MTNENLRYTENVDVVKDDLTRRLNESFARNIYREKGYKNRAEYLSSLAKEYGVDISVVATAATALGPEEDFDALPIEIEEYVDKHGSNDDVIDPIG